MKNPPGLPDHVP